LESTGWDKTPPAPELHSEVVARTREKYLEAFRQLTGTELGDE
jgi:phosphoribosylaminoimidazole-succinocarboxamide synthase